MTRHFAAILPILFTGVSSFAPSLPILRSRAASRAWLTSRLPVSGDPSDPLHRRFVVRALSPDPSISICSRAPLTLVTLPSSPILPILFTGVSSFSPSLVILRSRAALVRGDFSTPHFPRSFRSSLRVFRPSRRLSRSFDLEPLPRAASLSAPCFRRSAPIPLHRRFVVRALSPDPSISMLLSRVADLVDSVHFPAPSDPLYGRFVRSRPLYRSFDLVLLSRAAQLVTRHFPRSFRSSSRAFRRSRPLSRSFDLALPSRAADLSTPCSTRSVRSSSPAFRPPPPSLPILRSRGALSRG